MEFISTILVKLAYLLRCDVKQLRDGFPESQGSIHLSLLIQAQVTGEVLGRDLQEEEGVN